MPVVNLTLGASFRTSMSCLHFPTLREARGLPQLQWPCFRPLPPVTEFQLRLHGGPASFSLYCVLSVLLRPVFIGSSGQQSRDTSAELCRLHVQQPPAASAPNFPPNFFAHLPWMRGPDNHYKMIFSTIYNFCKTRIYVQLCNHLNHSVKFLCVNAGPRSFLSHAPRS